MTLYLGSKRVIARPMNRAEYNVYRGWELPANEDGADEGYLVEYLDGGKPNMECHAGYVSWSPKEQFDNGYVSIMEGFDFGEAIKQAKLGRKVARKGWNGSGMFAYIVPANSYPAQTEAIKGQFEDDMIPYREYWALKTAQDDIAMWSPSGSDSLANDWNIVE